MIGVSNDQHLKGNTNEILIQIHTETIIKKITVPDKKKII